MFDDTQPLPAREAVYQQLMQQNQGMMEQDKALLSQIGGNAQMTKPQMMAMLLMGMLPTLVGGIVKGKKGLAAGAQAGAIGTSTMAKGLELEDAEKDKSLMLQSKNLNERILKNEALQGDLQQDQFKAEDTARENQLNRSNSLNVASIRAGGDAAAGENIGKALSAQSKALDVEKKQTEANARQAISKFRGMLYKSDGTVRDEDLDAIRAKKAAHETVLDSLQKMQQIVAGMDHKTAESTIGDSSTELGILHANALGALEEAKKVPGAIGNAGLTRLETILKNPTSLVRNVIGNNLPFTTTVEKDMNIAARVLNDSYDRFMKSKGVTGVPIGTPMTHEGQVLYVIDVDPATNQYVYTSRLDKVNAILESQGLAPIGGRK